MHKKEMYITRKYADTIIINTVNGKKCWNKLVNWDEYDHNAISYSSILTLRLKYCSF